MGTTVQWRGENEREPASYGKTISFGNIRDKGTAYMSYSDRVGPGIVVVGGSHELCDRLTVAGFTALAPVLPEEPDRAGRLIDAAIDHLVDNWHPRVGLVVIGGADPVIEEVASRRTLDAVAFFSAEDEIDEDVVDDFRYDLS